MSNPNEDYFATRRTIRRYADRPGGEPRRAGE